MLRTAAPLVLAKGIQLNKEMTGTLLQYVNPLFANVTGLSGIANFECQTLVIPLAAGLERKAEVTGTISADNVLVAASGLLDEIFKANSAILNSMLTLVNERVFHNDGQPVACPLVTLFGASNDLPEGKDLEALFDRFLVRFEVGYLLRPANLKLVLAAPDPKAATVMTKADLRKAQAEVAKVTVTDETIEVRLAYDVARGIHFDGMQYRRDIGHRAIK